MNALRFATIALAVPLGALFIPAVAQARVVTESWYLEGPRSGADVKRVEDALRHLPGVSSFEVSQATLDVRFDDQKINDARLKAAVAQAGGFRLTRRAD
jgi:copper chaperone CopZ